MKLHYKAFFGVLFPLSAIGSTHFFNQYSIYLNIVLFITCSLIGYFLYRQTQRFKKYRIKAKEEHKRLNHSNDRIWLSGLKSFSTATFTSDGKLINANKSFQESFGQYLSTVDDFDSFLQEFFFKDKALKKTKRVYRFKHDIKNEYFISTSLNRVSGVRICEIFKFDVQELVELGENRKFELDNDRVNALDIFEEVIASRLSFSGCSYNTLPKVESIEGLILFTGEVLAERLFRNIFNVVAGVIDLKEITEQLNIELTRVDKDFVVSVKFKNYHISDKDLSSSIQSSQGKVSLISLMQEIEKSAEHMRVKSTLKNISDNNDIVSELKVTISDLSNVKWVSKSYKRGHEVTI